MLQKLNLVAKGRAGRLLALLALTSIGGWAQSTQGGVRGAVTDSSGAAIPNVKVVLINEGTTIQREGVTNSAGLYDFQNVVPATYTVTAEAPSFKKFERRGILVATQEFLTVDVQMEVGKVTESVLVTEQMPLVESSDASQGQVLDNQKLVELPNLGRNPFMMSRLAQNVVQVGPPAYNRMEDQSGSSMISISGGPVRGNNYLLDGIPITDATNRAIIIPTLESVAEVKIQANTYDAEMARTGGGMFNTLMKSGTNDFHGSLYGHIRSTNMDANAFFSNAAGIPITNQPNKTWGASFGGPVRIPHIYDGRNHTFFFLGIEHYDDVSSDSGSFSLPSALERVGDFSQSYTTAAHTALHIIYDPATGLPIAGNKLSKSQMTPVGLTLASYIPAPASSPAYFGALDQTVASTIKARAVQYTGKLDEDFTHWWHASLSYARYYSLEPGDTWFNTPATTAGWRLQRRVDATAINSIFTVNPTTVVALRYGFNRFPNYGYNSSQGFNIGVLGFTPSWANLVNGPNAEFPQIGMNSIYGIGESDGSYADLASHNFSASLDKTIGRHTLKGGFDYRYIATSGGNIPGCPTGCFSFNTSLNAAGNGPGNNSNTGTDLADLLMGLPYDRQAGTASYLHNFINYYGGFVQDNFRISSKLSINAGLRWEHESGLQEVHNGLLVGFNTTGNTPITVPGLTPKGYAQYAGANGAPTTAGNYPGSKWGPRAGAVYQLNPKTVIRGGYGIFYAPQIALGGPWGTPGYTNNTEYTGKSTTDVLTNPFPTGLLAPVGSSQGTAVDIGSSLSLISPTAKSPIVQQYSIDLQRELAGGIGIEVGYVGSHSTHLTLGAPGININALNPSYLSQGVNALEAQVANPFYGNPLITSGTLSGKTISAFRLLLPYTAYTSVTTSFGDQNHASYNSLVIKAQKRFSHGLTFLSTLTASVNKDESSGGVGSSLNSGAQGAPQNPYDMASEYSYSNVDTPLRWASSFSYELPVGKGRHFAGNINRAMDYVIGGWEISSVLVYQTGFPLQIFQSNQNGDFGYGAQRPNTTSTSAGTSGSVESRIGNYINPAAFSLAPAATFGNTPRTLGSLRGPGQKNWDSSLFKNFLITERVKAQFRAEALNAFNSPLFHSPNTQFGTPTFGQISGQDNFARQMQLAIRVTF